MKLTMKLSYMFQDKARNTPVLILVRIRELQSAFVKNESSSFSLWVRTKGKACGNDTNESVSLPLILKI